MAPKVWMLLCLSASVCVQAAENSFSDEIAWHRAVFTNNNRGEEGVKFTCSGKQLIEIDRRLSDYFHYLGIKPSLVVRKLDPQQKSLVFTLTTPPTDVSTIDFRIRPDMDIQEQLIQLPSVGQVKTVSEKEIVLALMQHGRLTEFSGKQCTAEALIDHVKIRQNTVAWSETLEWVWPDGGKAKWNNKYWNKGTPLPDISPAAAIADAFQHQNKYGIGCYTAAKLAMIHGVLDYYHRIKKSPTEASQIEQRLMVDGEPLVDIEPRALWSFETDFDFSELWNDGKLLEMHYNIPGQNFVPGDWVYIRNTDPKTKDKIGYEGANAIYLGRGKFSDYYNDHAHAYSFHEKLNEVYQWRNGVFNRVRDKDKAVPLSEDELGALSAPPEAGGLLMDVRLFFLPQSQ